MVSWPFLNAIYFKLTNSLNGWLISPKCKKDRLCSYGLWIFWNNDKKVNHNKLVHQKRSKHKAIQMTMKILISIVFSCCGRFSDHCKRYSTWPTFLQHCSLCSSEILYVKLLLDVSQTPQAYWYCVSAELIEDNQR